MAGIYNYLAAVTSTPMTLWDNPFSRVVNHLYRSVQASIHQRVQDLSITRFFQEDPFGYALSTSVTLPIELTNRLIYSMGERFFHTWTLLPYSFCDLDALSKAASLASGVAGVYLGDAHPFVALVDSGKSGIDGAIFAKHIPSFWKKDFMKMWDSANGRLIFGSVLKTAYPLFFQGAHLCAALSYAQKCGFVNYATVAASIGTRLPILRPVIDEVYGVGLSNLKNGLVVAGAVIATASAVEFLIHKAVHYRNRNGQTFEGFRRTISDREEDSQMRTSSNNFFKAWVVYGTSFGQWSTTTPVFQTFANLLGITNAYGSANTVIGENEKLAQSKGQLASIFLKSVHQDQIPAGIIVQKVGPDQLAENVFVGG